MQDVTLWIDRLKMSHSFITEHDKQLEKDEEEDRRNRFGHLLQPIRDLAENFNIDLAHELEDYLDDLEQLTISFSSEDGVRKLNFAEAALLIRGSSLIYSKKVDYLYDLVFKVLDSVTAQKDKRIRVDLHGEQDDDNTEGKGSRRGGMISSNADFVDAFLSLDDIDEANNISLEDEVVSETAGAYRSEWDVDARRGEALSFAVPLAFLQAANIRGNGQQGSNNFKLSTSHVHPSGALLLNPSSSMQYHHLSDNTTPLCISTGFVDGSRKESRKEGGLMSGSLNLNLNDDDDMHDDGMHDGYGDMNDDFGCDMNDDFGGNGFDEADYNQLTPASPSVSVSQRLFSPRDHGGRSNNRALDPGELERTVDHWVMHSPHEQVHRSNRPFRAGASFFIVFYCLFTLKCISF